MVGQVSINYLAVLVTAIVGMAIGTAWYSKGLFGSAWLKETKMTNKQISDAKKSGKVNKIYLYMFLLTILSAYVLANLVDLFEATTFGSGLYLGFILWLGIIVPTLAGQFMFGGKSSRLYWITAGHHLVGLMIMAAILAVWP